MPLPGDVSQRAGGSGVAGRTRFTRRGGRAQRGRGSPAAPESLSAPQRRAQNARYNPGRRPGKRAAVHGGQRGGVARAVPVGGGEDDESRGGEDDESSGGSDDDDESGSQSDTERAGVADEKSGWRQEMAEMSLEELQRARETMGTKEFERRSAGAQTASARRAPRRRDKNRPVEMSSKNPVGHLRQVISMKKQVVRDPRFDELSGSFNETIFQSTYSFLDSIREREKQELKKQLKKVKSSGQKEKIEYLLQRMENQERAKQKQEKQREAEIKAKHVARERMLQGQTPFYVKKSELRKQELAEKYQELKKLGKVDKFLSQKRMRNAQRDRRKLPPPKRERGGPEEQQ